MQKANEGGVELDALPITPAQVAAVVKLVDEGKLSNKLARQVIEGVLAGEGEPEQVMTDRGLAVVRDDSVIQAAVDEALAANPDVAEKIRGGKVQAAGAIVGAVMKATKGQADAARVRELVLRPAARRRLPGLSFPRRHQLLTPSWRDQVLAEASGRPSVPSRPTRYAARKRSRGYAVRRR